MKSKALLLNLILLISIAAFGAGISLSPLVTELVLPPGTAYTGAIYVTNTGDEPVTVEAQVLGFTAPEGIPQFLKPGEDTYPYSGRNLLTLEPTKQRLEPGETATFNYQVQMPEDLDPYGGRYVAAVFTVEPPASEGAQVVIAARVASLFLISPGTDAVPHLKIEAISIRQSDTNPRQVILEATITNDGNAHISSGQIVGHVYVTDEDAYIVDDFQVWTHTMLPGNTYRHEENWTVPEKLPSGTYQFNLDILIFSPVGTEPQRYLITMPVDLNF